MHHSTPRALAFAALLIPLTLSCTGKDGDSGPSSDGADGADGGDGADGADDNNSPELTDLSLSPNPVTTDGVLTATVSATDPDGDPLTLTYAWTVDGDEVQSGSDDTLDGAVHFDKGHEIAVTVTADDGADTSSLASDPVVAINTAPGAPTLSLDPEPPEHGAALTCAVATTSADADSDPVTYTMAWTVNGAGWPDEGGSGSADSGGGDSGAPTTSTWPGDTVPTGVVQEGQTWTCTATPNDGDEDGATAEVSGTAICTGAHSYAEPASLTHLRRAGWGSFEDIDGDSDLDLMWGHGTQVKVERNDVGVYSLIWTQPAGMISRTHFQPFDMDGDGHFGVAVSHLDSASFGYSGKAMGFDNVAGTISTSRSWQEDRNTWPAGITVGDINNDGYDDVFVHNHPGAVVTAPSALYANSGGTVSASPTTSLGHPTAWGDLGDIDGDGDLELLTCAVHTCGHCPSSVYQQAVIYDFDSSWGMSRVWTSPTTGSGQTDNNDHRCEFGDVNGDGALDVITAGKWAYAYSSGTTTRGVRLYLNDGAGSISTTPDQTVSATGTTTLVVGDVTGDGFDEILFGDNSTVSVYGNDFSVGANTYIDGSAGLVQLAELTGVSNVTDIDDLTGDGIGDLVVQQGGELRVLTQTCE